MGHRLADHFDLESVDTPPLALPSTPAHPSASQASSPCSVLSCEYLLGGTQLSYSSYSSSSHAPSNPGCAIISTAIPRWTPALLSSHTLTDALHTQFSSTAGTLKTWLIPHLASRLRLQTLQRQSRSSLSLICVPTWLFL